MFKLPDSFEVPQPAKSVEEKPIKGGIYAVLNLVNGKFYIGSAVNLRRRWTNHKSLLNSNKHYNIHLQRAWAKHGELNFIIVILEYTVDLQSKEQHYIDTLAPTYNILTTAYNSTGYKHTEEAVASFKARVVSDEVKAALSARLKDKKQDPDFVKHRTKSLKGKKRSEEIRAKMAKAQSKRYALSIDPNKMIDWHV